MATTWNVADAQFATLDAKIKDAAVLPGDTIQITQVGTWPYSQTLIVNKAISIIGLTTVDSVNGTAVDKTIITCNSTSQIIQFTAPVDTHVCRLSGFTFVAGTGKPANGIIYLSGKCKNNRIDHCHFIRAGIPVGVWASSFGVADHNLLETTGDQAFQINFRDYPYANGAAADMGHGSWNSPSDLGSEKFWFMEDNFFTAWDYTNNVTFASPANPCHGIDGTWGNRYCFRYNICYDSCPMQNHGTEGVASRGGRVREVYRNKYHFSFKQSANGSARSGVSIFHDNSWGGESGVHPGQPPGWPAGGDKNPDISQSIQSYRNGQNEDSPWGGASGVNPWDVNDVSAGPISGANAVLTTSIAGVGTFVNGNSFSYSPTTGGLDHAGGVNSAGGLYWAGVVNSFTQTGLIASTITQNNAGWAPGMWVDFCVRKVTVSGGGQSGYLNVGSVTSNTADTINIGSGSTPREATALHWAVNDHFEIRRALIVLDQPGRGQCDKITGVSSQTPPPPTDADQGAAPIWPRNALEPTYFWNDTFGPGGATAMPMDPKKNPVWQRRANVDYFNSTSAPATILTTRTGVGTGPPWVASPLAYTEFTYPHPLVGPQVITPRISSASTATFVKGGPNQDFQITVADFSGTPVTISYVVNSVPAGATAATLPTGITFVTAITPPYGLFRDATGATSGAIAGDYTLTLSAAHTGDTTATQGFTLTMKNPDAVNQFPSVSITAPANGATYTTAQTVTINVTAGDFDGTVNQVDILDGTTVIKTFGDGSGAVAPPYSYSTGMSAGSHSLTAWATDNNGAVTKTGTVGQQAAIGITVSPVVGITAPTIVVSA